MRGISHAVIELERAARLAKALDPTNPRDFLVICDRLAAALREHVNPLEQSVVDRAVQGLDVDWPALSPSSRDHVFDAVDRVLAQLPSRVERVVDDVLKHHDVTDATMRATAKAYRLRVSTSVQQAAQKIALTTRRSQGNFVTDEYGRRRVGFSEKAREVVQRGMEQGLGRDDIVADLQAEMPAALLGRSGSYFDVVAMSFSNRARTFTQLASFDDAGLTHFVFEAVLDEVTSVVCRFMHGRVFNVGKGLQRIREVEAARDPEEIRDLQPWVRVYQDEDGNQRLGYRKGEKVHHVANVDESAVGELDEVGSFSGGLDEAALEAAGITMPPLHGRCRSTILPEL